MDHHGTDGQRLPAGLPAQGRDDTDRQVPHVGQNGCTGEKGRLSSWISMTVAVLRSFRIRHCFCFVLFSPGE